MLEGLLNALHVAGLDPSSEGLADALWLATQILPPARGDTSVLLERQGPAEAEGTTEGATGEETSPATSTGGGAKEPEVGPAKATPGRAWLKQEGPGVSIRPPDAPALPHSREIARALRPLSRRVPSRTLIELDEAETAEKIARTGLWLPELRPAAVRWFELALVVDRSRSMAVWLPTAHELFRLLQYHGAFRDVRAWTVETDVDRDPLTLREGIGGRGAQRPLGEVTGPRGARAVLVLSDCVGRAWQSGRMREALWSWSSSGPLAIVQTMPEPMWLRTGLRLCTSDWFRSRVAGALNGSLHAELEGRSSVWDGPDEGPPSPRAPRLPVPVFTLEAAAVGAWVRLVLGVASGRLPGVFMRPPEKLAPSEPGATITRGEVDASKRIELFDGASSTVARRLARRLAVIDAPLSLPIARLVMGAVVPEATPAQLAEVLFGGLTFETVSIDDAKGDPDGIRHTFHKGVRERLIEDVPGSEMARVFDLTSQYVERELGTKAGSSAVVSESREGAFASIRATVLRLLGREYAGVADRVEMSSPGIQGDPRGEHGTGPVRRTWTRAKLSVLRLILQPLYPRQKEIWSLIRDTGIDVKPNEFNLHGRTDNIWTEVLHQLNELQSVDEFVQEIASQFPDHADLRNLLNSPDNLPPNALPHVWSSSDLARARRLLVQLYDDVPSMRRATYEVGMDLELIDFKGTAEDVWYEILLQLNRMKRVDDLIRLAAEEFGTNDEVHALLDLTIHQVHRSWTEDELERASRVLTKLYPRLSSLKRVVGDADFDLSKIELGETVANAWRHVLSYINKSSGNVERILQIALREYPDNTELQSLTPSRHPAPPFPVRAPVPVHFVTDEELLRMQNLFVVLFPNVQDIRRVISDLGIPRSLIDFSGEATNAWLDALNELRRRQSLDDLIQYAITEFPDNAELKELLFATNLPESVSPASEQTTPFTPIPSAHPTGWRVTFAAEPIFNELSGERWRQLQDALASSFRTYPALREFIQFRFNADLDRITSVQIGLQQQLYDLIQWSQANGSTEKLFRAARAERPGNPRLLAFELVVTAPGPQSRPKPIEESSFEQVLRKQVPMLKLDALLRNLSEIGARVCRVELNGTMRGTGFLVGPSCAITCYHVVQDLLEGSVAPGSVQLRFDHCPGNQGTVFPLVTDWLVHASRYAPFEATDPRGGTPTQDELDYVILRIDGSPGQEPIGSGATPGAPRRGWVVIPEGTIALSKDAPLFILHHPQGRPLETGLDTHGLIEINANRTRLRHRVDTDAGSAGAPLFDLGGTLVGLHQSNNPSSTPAYKQAILIDAIRYDLERAGKLVDLGD